MSATAAVNLADQAEAGSEAAREPGQIIGDAVAGGAWEVVDLSLTTAENHPTNWPTDPQFHVIPMTWFKRIPGPNGTNGAVEPSDAAVQRYEINEHTATQIDFPPHFIPPPGLDIPGAPGSRWGLVTGDKIELAAFMGPAVVVDVRDLLNSNHTAGVSAHITRDWLLQWEQRYGRFRANEVPMWFSGYTDRYYRPFPDNDRFQDRMLWKPIVEKSEPGWVAADPGAVELLHERGVRACGHGRPQLGSGRGRPAGSCGGAQTRDDMDRGRHQSREPAGSGRVLHRIALQGQRPAGRHRPGVRDQGGRRLAGPSIRTAATVKTSAPGPRADYNLVSTSTLPLR